MPFLGRSSIVAFAGLLASGACSLLAPSDDSLLGGEVARDAAPHNPDRTVDGEPDSADSGGGTGATDGASPEDATSDSVEAETGADGADEDGGADATPSCKDAGQCEPGSFCTPLGRCRSCSDPATLRNPSELEFGPPEPLTATNDAAGLFQLRHPRAFDKGTALVYERTISGGQLMLTPDPLQSPGAPLPAPIEVVGAAEEAALQFTPPVGALSVYNFFYNALVTRGTVERWELFGANVGPNGSTSAVARLPAPFNEAPSAAHNNYTLALSQNRAIWATSDGSLLVRLMTAPLDAPIPKQLLLPDANQCVLNQLDWSPWLAHDGRVLFFNAIERTQDCQRIPGDRLDIYVVGLNDDGTPSEAAVPLRGISRPGTAEFDASLSVDHCWLYYAYDTGSVFRLARARRVR